MPRDIAKTLSYLAVHLTIGFTVAYAFTGSIEIAGGLAIIEPMVNAVVVESEDQAVADIAVSCSGE